MKHWYKLPKRPINKFSKKLCLKEHLTTMLYCIFARGTFISEAQTGLELCNGKLNHMQLKKVPPRSTLSDGNKKRTSDVFGSFIPKPISKI